MILADTVGYHRGGKPVEGRRILVTFTYASGTPITDRTLWLHGAPRWARDGIQKAAVRTLLRKPSPAAPSKRKFGTKAAKNAAM